MWFFPLGRNSPWWIGKRPSVMASLSRKWRDGWAPTIHARVFSPQFRARRATGRGRTADAQLLVADALAMAVALQPDIVMRAENHHVAVELDGMLTRGATVVDWENRFGLAANASIVLDVDQERFEALIASALGVSA